MKKDSRMLQTRLVQLEMLLSQATKIQNELFEKLPDEDKTALIENFENISKLNQEYAKICTVVNADNLKNTRTEISKEFRNVKELLKDVSPSELTVKLADKGSCWTSCETCVTSCIKCVTDIGLSPGNTCGISSMVASWCKPKIDIGDQDFHEDVEEMFVKWKK